MDADRVIAEDFVEKYPFQAAQVLEGRPDEEVTAFLQEISQKYSLVLLNLMNTPKAAKCFSSLPEEMAKELIEQADLPLAESLLRQFDEPYRANLLATLPPDLAGMLKRKLEQGVNTVGALMIAVTAVNKEMTVGDLLEMARKNQGAISGHLYAVDGQGKFEGMVRLEDILGAKPSSPIASLLNTATPKFFSDIPLNEVADHPAWHEYRFIPIIDRYEILLGALPFAKIRATTEKKPGQLTKDLFETSTALGELYRIGLTGFLQSVGK